MEDAMPITRNIAKRKMQDGQMALGFQVYHLRSVATPLLAAASGYDFLFIDMEHGAFSLQEATQLCIASLPTGVAPLVRVCSGALDEGTRLLDNGAMGIVVPHVDTAEQAKRISEAFHYPPDGTRSWGGPPALFGYQAPDMAAAQREINDEIMTVVMIESPEAVRNAAAIAAVPGIDVLLFGSSDLTTELGIPGQMGHQKLIDAYQTVGDACRAHGKILGMGGINDDEDARRYVGMGCRFVLTGADHNFVIAGAKAKADVMRALVNR
jgi:2-keto-3-deoxy-L-rhamnonate aldolase RhmA